HGPHARRGAAGADSHLRPRKPPRRTGMPRPPRPVLTPAGGDGYPVSFSCVFLRQSGTASDKDAGSRGRRRRHPRSAVPARDERNDMWIRKREMMRRTTLTAALGLALVL